MQKPGKATALILGGYVNGYSIVKELYEQGITEILLFDEGRSLAQFSNKIKYHPVIDKSPELLLKQLQKISESYDYIVVFPTDDLQLENLYQIYDDISSFCYIPFNRDTLLKSLDKTFQYQICEKIGVPYPKSVSVISAIDLDKIDELAFPLIIKPSVRKDSTTNVFRNRYILNLKKYLKEKDYIIEKIKSGIEFIVSEYIPGDDTNIYAYTCFRSNEGAILNEWTGKKLSQYPDNYGVFSSSSNEAPDIIFKQGRMIVEGLNAFGIVEPEFKYDYRDDKYKLMETNLRSMMWHRTGSISGVKLHETQFKYATKQTINEYKQERSQRIHFVLMMHEIPNLISRPNYWKYFKHNVWGGDKRIWALFDLYDIKPFFYSLLLLTRRGAIAWVRRLGLR